MFSIKLFTKKSINDLIPYEFSIREYYDELDDARSIIDDICEIFRESEEIMFVVSGFGQKNWPVDCFYDLPVIIEQVPEIIRKINENNYNFELEFFEQGIERVLQFKDYGNYVSVECLSRTDWVPSPSKIDMRKENIKNLFEDLLKRFLDYGKVLCIELINNPMLKEWIKNK